MVSEGDRLATVFVDADNTLWDTNAVYAQAQLSLLAAVERRVGRSAPEDDRLQFLRQVDQELALRHHAGLRYPPVLLAHALALVVRGEPAPSGVRRVLKEVEHGGILSAQDAQDVATDFFSALAAVPRPRAGVLAGLRALHADKVLTIVVTEGAQARIVETAAALGLADYIDRIVEAPKQVRLYSRVMKLSRVPSPMFMVGDQLQRDIAPAKAAGLETIYFPGDFAPKWEPAEDEVCPDHRIVSFDAVPQIVKARLGRAAKSR